MALQPIKRSRRDRAFTKELKTLQLNTCQRCLTHYPANSKGLHVSHFYSRRRACTRYFLDNTDLLCFGCHMLWQKELRADYIRFKKRQLGKERYDRLRAMALAGHKDLPPKVKYVTM